MIITEPFGSPEQVIIVLLSSKKSHSDTTVVLSTEDHKFIKHDTVVSYARSRIMPCEHIMARIQQRDFRPHDNFQNDVIRKIQHGLINSVHTPRNIKNAFGEALTDAAGNN